MRLGFLLIPLALAWFALSPQARAVCRQGCDTNTANTFLGDNALLNNTGGGGNTAIGFEALFSNTSGGGNTAAGIQALFSNTSGNGNTATGDDALVANTTGGGNTAAGIQALFDNTTGSDNTATGAYALIFNTTGISNTATGEGALFSNTNGFENTATGVSALQSNTTGTSNTANGVRALSNNSTGCCNTANGINALFSNTGGFENTATGIGALQLNTTGNFNTATGDLALNSNTTGGDNTATGDNALGRNTTGESNIALGESAGFNLTTGSNNIDIGNKGQAGESKTIRIGKQGIQTKTVIAGIRDTTVTGGVAVMIDSNGRLGTVTSSERFKDAIKPMDKASEAILDLEPVTFRYKHELDPEGIPQFGLVAEQVEKVNPDLVARDEQGKPYSVRYEAVNAMLLNEFLKQHCKVQEQEATITQQRQDFETAIAHQQKEIEALTATVKEQTAQIQKVSAQLAASKPAPQVALNNQ